MRVLVYMLLGVLVSAHAAAAAPNGLAVLLTDYGADSIYVGVLKGAMYSKNPQARIETITNSVPNYDIAAGAYILAEACRQWPAGTAFCCVVDPGVGTARKPIAIETNTGQFFVGPDNGLLALVAQRDGIKAAHELTNEKYHGPNARSSTFHGRDIFGPVTAALAGGADIADLGPKLAEIVQIDFPKARVENGAIHGAIIRADGYGNLVSNVPAEMMEEAGLKKGDEVEVTIGKSQFTAPYHNTYAEAPVGARLLCSQSIGMVEAAINQGDLAAVLGEGVHAAVILRRAGAADSNKGAELIYFSQSGGIAGEIYELTVSGDGECHLKSRRKADRDFSIGKEGAAKLAELAETAFAAKPLSRSGPQPGGADFLSYAVRYKGQEKAYNDLNAPEAFKPLTRALTEVLGKHGR
jgi:S-adenosylmethionine hydrolase